MTTQIRRTKPNKARLHSFLGFGISFVIRHSSFVICVILASASILATIGAPTAAPNEVVVHPKPYSGPLRNPLMGFIGAPNGKQQYATLAREYVRWNAIENSVDDKADKLRAYMESHWKGVEQRNIKIIPRVF